MANRTLKTQDEVLYNILRKEKSRQRECIELIASENFTSRAVMECLGSATVNKYSEGYPGRRYYGGTEHIDELEILCQNRALTAFNLDKEIWGVNVQPYSGSPANFEVLTALLNPHDRIMGLDLPSGGHLTHGFYSGNKKVSATSVYFESLPYKVDPISGMINYEELEKQALLYRPKVIIAGVSAYSRNLDYKRFREICDKIDAVLFGDMSHIAGLVAAKLGNNPFEYCDLVTSTSHKTLRGPRAGIIFFNKKNKILNIDNIEDKINSSVFPGLQGGPHNNQIAALACQLGEVCGTEWKKYCDHVIRNCVCMIESLKTKGYNIVCDGSDCHLFVWDLRSTGLTGTKMQDLCDAVNITLNKNSIPCDTSPFSPSGVRIGSPAMTSRQMTTQDFIQISEFLHKVVIIGQSIKETSGTALKEFREGIKISNELQALKKEVIAWVSKYHLPGADDI